MKTLTAVFLLALTVTAQAEVGVARSAFTTNIENREPVDEVGQLGNDADKVYFFTELRGLNGHAITHRWEQGGEVKAEVTFNVGGDRWRVWSSKNLHPSWLGEWQVSVVDEGGNVLAQESFAYVPAGDAAAEGADDSSQGMHMKDEDGMPMKGEDSMSSDKMETMDTDDGDSDASSSQAMDSMNEGDAMKSGDMGGMHESSE